MDTNHQICDLCQVTFTSKAHSEAHYQGKKHKRKAAYNRPCPAGAELDRLSQDSFTDDGLCQVGFGDLGTPTRNTDFQSPGRPNESGYLYYCDTCSKNFSGPAPMKQHMESFAHEKQVKKVQKSPTIRSSPGFLEDLSTGLDEGSRVLNGSSKLQPNLPSGKEGSGMKQTDHTDREYFCRFPMFSESGSLADRLWMTDRGRMKRSQEFGARKAFPGNGTALRSILIQVCKIRMEEEVSRVIPVIAESVVDAVLDNLPGSQEEDPSVSRQDEGAQPEDTTSSCRQTESNSRSFSEGFRKDEGPESGGVEKDKNHLGVGSSQINGDHPKSQRFQSHSIVDSASKTSNGTCTKLNSLNPNAPVYEPREPREYQSVVSSQHDDETLMSQNRLDGLDPVQHEHDKPLTYVNIGDKSEERGCGTEDEKSAPKHDDHREPEQTTCVSPGEPFDEAELEGATAATSAASLEESALRQVSAVDDQSGIQTQEIDAEERVSSVTSQDLIQFDELYDSGSEQFHSAVSAIPENATIQPNNHTPVGRIGSVSPGAKHKAAFLAIEETSTEPYQEEPTLASDFKDVVGEIFQALGSHLNT